MVAQARERQTIESDRLPTRRRIRLGRSAVEITDVGLGLREVGRSPENTRRLLVAAGAAGIDYIDVSPSYGFGLAELRLRPALRSQRFVVSTKVGAKLGPPRSRFERAAHAVHETLTGGVPAVDLGLKRLTRIATRDNVRGDPQPRVASGGVEAAAPDATSLSVSCDFSFDGTLRSVEESCVRLGVDHLDIVYLHDPEVHRGASMRGAYRALHALRAEGTVRAIGVAMNHASRLAWFAPRGDFDVFMIAGRYTLLDQSAAADLFPIAKARGITVVVAGVFNGGLLADPRPGVPYNYGPPSPAMVARAIELRAICESFGVPWRAAALQFSRAHPAVDAVLLGAATPAELTESLDDLERVIPDALWSELRERGVGRD